MLAEYLELVASHKWSMSFCALFADLELLRALRECLKGSHPLPGKQLHLTAIASIILPVSLASEYLPMHDQEKTRDASISHLYSCNTRGKTGSCLPALHSKLALNILCSGQNSKQNDCGKSLRVGEDPLPTDPT